jgi:hypothetical protein
VRRRTNLTRKRGTSLSRDKRGSRQRSLDTANESTNRGKLLTYVFALILLCLAVNTMLCVWGLADSHALEERIGAVFWGACGALMTGLSRVKL